MAKLHQGVFTPIHPEKYKGTSPIIFRSGWEKKMMTWLDSNPNCLFWASESHPIPYYHPVKRRMARYFPDFYASFKTNEGNIEKYIIEVKPLKETIAPQTKKYKRKQTQLYEELTYLVNMAKWEAAQKFCQNNGLKFQIITEKQLYKYK